MIRDNARVKTLQTKLSQARTELREALAEIAHTEVEDYVFANLDGPVKLSQIFDGKKDLFVIHNMGTTCPNCAMWADGFNGLYPHIADRASFVVSSPDPPEVQAQFAKARGWRFPMVSDQSKGFFDAMGFLSSDRRAQPGVSAFQKQGSKIMRVSAAGMEPFDDFCAVWHLFDLLPEGADGWKAKFKYS